MQRVCIASGQRRHTPSCTNNKAGRHLMSILSISLFFFLPAELYVCIIEYWQGDWVFCCWLFIWFGVFFFFSRRKNGGKSPIFIIADYKRQSCSCLSGVNTSLSHHLCYGDAEVVITVSFSVCAGSSCCCSYEPILLQAHWRGNLDWFFVLVTSSTTVKSKYSVNAVIVV